MSKKLILLIGAPGSGKTTDAKLIAEKHTESITSYSTGDLIKEEIKNEYIFNNVKIKVVSVLEIKVNDTLAKERWLAAGRSEDIFEHELKSYKESLSEIEAHYDKKDVLKVIDGNKDINAVITEIDAYLESVCTSF
jgi:adenylate kinase